MKPRVFKPSTLTAASAVTAAVAALTLTACGPNDADETAQLAATSAAQPAAPSTVAPPLLVERQGTPVPPAGAAVPTSTAPAPVQVATAQPGAAPQPAYPAQSSDSAPPPNDAVSPPAPQPRAVDRSRVGSIESIEPVRERPQGTGAGAVIGGVLGAVVGNQFGSGSGRAIMTGAGAVGGAVAGNNVERNRNTTVTGYKVAIRLDNGATRTFQRAEVGSLRVGDRVRLDARSFHRV